MKKNISSDACKLLHLLPLDGDIHNLRALISISWHTFSNGKNCNRGESQTKDRTPRINWLILIFFPQYSSGIVGPLCQSVQSCFASNFCATILSAGSPCWTNNYHRAAVRRGPQTCSEFSSILLKRCIVHHTCQDEGETHHCCFLKRSRFAPPPSSHLPQTSSITSVCCTWWSAIYFRYAHVVSDSATWKCLHLKRRSNQTRSCVATQLQ